MYVAVKVSFCMHNTATHNDKEGPGGTGKYLCKEQGRKAMEDLPFSRHHRKALHSYVTISMVKSRISPESAHSFNTTVSSSELTLLTSNQPNHPF